MSNAAVRTVFTAQRYKLKMNAAIVQTRFKVFLDKFYSLNGIFVVKQTKTIMIQTKTIMIQTKTIMLRSCAGACETCIIEVLQAGVRR
jgi:hypothetical protein